MDYEYSRDDVDWKWRVLDDSGLEIYFGLGEGWYGPRFFDPLDEAPFPDRDQWFDAYAIVARKVLGDLAAMGATKPAFVEIWNEPDGRYFWSPEGDDVAAFAEEFRLLFSALRREVEDNLDTAYWTAPPALGGCGFTGGGMEDLEKAVIAGDPGSAKVGAILDELVDEGELTRLDFISAHLYGSPLRDTLENQELTEAFDRYVVEALDWVYKLVFIGAGLDDYREHGMHHFSLARTIFEHLPRHLTEWNFAPMSSLAQSYTEDWSNPMWGGEGLGFVSAALTWLHHPSLKTTRAHFYSGYEPAGGLFFSVAGTQGTFVKLLVRPAAIAFHLHAGLEGDRWVPLTIDKDVDQTGNAPDTLSFDDVLAAGKHHTESGRDVGDDRDAIAITALATESEEDDHGRIRRTVILTNLDRENRDVGLTLLGFNGGTAYKITRQTSLVDPGLTVPLEWSVSCEPDQWIADVLHGSVRGVSPWTPNTVELDSLFEEQIERVRLGQRANYNGALEWVVAVPARGIVRLDIVLEGGDRPDHSGIEHADYPGTPEGPDHPGDDHADYPGTPSGPGGRASTPGGRDRDPELD
jgi:hypothetical protein